MLVLKRTGWGGLLRAVAASQGVPEVTPRGTDSRDAGPEQVGDGMLS